MTVPGTECEITKRQLTHLVVQDVLLHGRSDGTKLSKDRISRIITTSARVRRDTEHRDDPAVEGDTTHLQDDLAFGFVHADKSFKVWLGKLQQIRTRGTSGNVHGPIDLCNPSKQMMLQCQWYHETRCGNGRYVPARSTKIMERRFVPISACLGLAHFNAPVAGVRTLVDNGQWERWTRLLKAMKPDAQAKAAQSYKKRQRERRQRSTIPEQTFVDSNRDRRIRNRRRSLHDNINH